MRGAWGWVGGSASESPLRCGGGEEPACLETQAEWKEAECEGDIRDETAPPNPGRCRDGCIERSPSAWRVAGCRTPDAWIYASELPPQSLHRVGHPSSRAASRRRRRDEGEGASPVRANARRRSNLRSVGRSARSTTHR